ncbi:dipeptidyl peptidase 3-like [Tropilaelaps mercedesae]|uniref:Dipeptidyl peptidase 3 n=1 Tax=Tropilaelaps mercedesae TaxID=418985 RepID=A0A1V9XUU8_9ACAR|nr:dipeptidyl peptidase 3-like [Tropilaelaps mercedesae]
MAAVAIAMWSPYDPQDVDGLYEYLATAIRSTFAKSDTVMPYKFYPNETPFQKLDCETAFQSLSKREKLYAHYLSRASWNGQFITMFQTSPESPLIFIFLDKVLRLKPTVEETLAHLEKQHGFTKDDVKAFVVYVGAFMGNGGNYRGFGDSKFIPNVPIEKLNSVATEALSADELQFFTKHCIEPMMDYREKVRSLGFPDHGLTTYWSANCNEEDAKFVTEFLNSQKVEAWHHRVFKTQANTEGNDKDVYEIRFASRQLTSDPDTTPERLIGHEQEYKGKLFRFTRGDYSDLIPEVIANLQAAADQALNEKEQQMLLDYIKYFDTGSLAAHKDGSRKWIEDKGPAVETYIGFIETYRDPAGARAEFEGFAAVVNKESSKKLGELVNHAEEIIKSSMPWPKEFEKDSYLKPDFTALDTITFNDEIRQTEGFKNVHLQNVVMAYNAAAKISFVSEADAELLTKYREPAFEVQVGLHELLGHGSGKLFSVNQDGIPNFDQEKTIDPLTGEKVFKHEGQEANDLVYVNWFAMALSGLRGLENYNADTGKWGQAHSQARFVILRVLLEDAKGLIDIKTVTNKDDGKPDLFITLDRSKIETKGRRAIGDFLLKLQVYKATADFEKGLKMYLSYSKVMDRSWSGHDFLKFREVIIERKKPRTILVQSNTRLNKTSGDVDLISYPNSPEGYAQSWVDRYTEPRSLYDKIKKLYNKDLKYFPVN